MRRRRIHVSDLVYMDTAFARKNEVRFLRFWNENTSCSPCLSSPVPRRLTNSTGRSSSLALCFSQTASCLGFRVYGLGFRVWGSGFRICTSKTASCSCDSAPRRPHARVRVSDCRLIHRLATSFLSVANAHSAPSAVGRGLGFSV